MSKGQHRCVVCGKAVEGDAIRIAKGQYKGRSWRENKVWGHAHPKCFASSVDSPDIVMNELKRASREPATRAATS